MVGKLQRVAVIGSAGAGKSTLARKLGAITGLPVVHLDALFWHPGWVETPRSEWRSIQEKLVEEPRWIIDGNYGSTLQIRLTAADTVIFLDLPPWVCLWRVVKRSFLSAEPRPDLAPGCPERLDLEYLRFLAWVWRYPRDDRPAIVETLNSFAAQPGGPKRIVRLASDREAASFLRQVEDDYWTTTSA